MSRDSTRNYRLTVAEAAQAGTVGALAPATEATAIEAPAPAGGSNGC
jgi:hypothetical protein